MAYIALEKLHQLYDGYQRPVRIGGRELLLIQDAGRVCLIANRCPHMGAPLDRASLNGQVLRCPRHGIEFDLSSGQAVGAAAGCVGALEFIPLVYNGNTLGVDL